MDDFSLNRREEVLSLGEDITDEKPVSLTDDYELAVPHEKGEEVLSLGESDITDEKPVSLTDDYELVVPHEKGEARQGRRAVPNHTSAATPVSADGDLDGNLGLGGGGGAGGDQMGNAIPPDDMPPRPSRRQGGWADDTPKEKKSKGRRDVEAFNDDERLHMDSNMNQDDDDSDIPVIPDLEEVQEEDMATQIAAPPSVQVNRVATYRELDNYFQKHAALFTLDGEIDLKLLSTVLSPETQVFEEDKQWDWDRLFTEVASELQTEWEKSAAKTDG